MVTKHFLKTLLIFAAMIALGLLGVFLAGEEKMDSLPPGNQVAN